MDDERVVEEIITKFILNTCRLRQQPSRPAVQAAMACAAAAMLRPVDDKEADSIPLITGSAAEFYIEPMLPHIGDVDIMCHLSTELAIPRGYPPPTQLPDKFHNYVQVFEIIDSHLPGYVYLELRYLLTECVDYGTFNAVEYDRHMYRSNRVYTFSRSMHGRPALLIGALLNGALPFDLVPCVRCLVWPPQSAEWRTRHRNYGWPDSATVNRVVSNGCDVVGKAHCQCKQDEWMGEYQGRLSFSRAEIVLMNSWMPVQQIVYHMLRVFMKTERLMGSADNYEAGTLSNYHIKSLMLWACELKSKAWWTDDVNLVRISVELLHDLAVWLTDAQCPHYFINGCNLVDSTFNLEMITGRLISVSRSYLSSSFLNHYLPRCLQRCPHTVSWLFDGVSSPIKLQIAISAAVDWRHNTAPYDMWDVLKDVEFDLAYAISSYANPSTVSMRFFDARTYNIVTTYSARSLDYWLTELKKVGEGLVVYMYVLSLVFLRIARRTSRSGLNDELMDFLAVALRQPVGRRCHSSRRSSMFLLSRAVDLMKAADDRTESRSTVQLIEIELSKAYLYRALRCEDSDSESIYCLANVYLAALYYTTGHYQTAIDHCALVTRSQYHSQCSSHVVQGEILPQIDDEIDSVLGLAVFYQHLRTAAFNQQQRTYVSAFTTGLFAHYLRIKCVSVTKCQQFSNNDEGRSHTKYVTDTQQLFVADVLLWKILNCSAVHPVYSGNSQCPATGPRELNTASLVELLQKSAVEHLTSYRQIVARDFGSVATIVTTDFEALYAYKHGDYQRCLLLSARNVRTLLSAKSMPDFNTFPEFIQLLDDDIVSLTALTLIAHPDTRTPRRSFGRIGYVSINQLTLSLYLMTQCQLKLRHSVTSLAQTLDYIKVAHRELPVEATLDRLVLKMIARKTVTYITTMMNKL